MPNNAANNPVPVEYKSQLLQQIPQESARYAIILLWKSIGQSRLLA